MKLLLFSAASFIGLSLTSGSPAPFMCYSCYSDKDGWGNLELPVYSNGFMDGFDGTSMNYAANCMDPTKGGVSTVNCTTSCFSAFMNFTLTNVGNTFSMVVRGCGDQHLPGTKIYQTPGCCSNQTVNLQSKNVLGRFVGCPCNTGPNCNAISQSVLQGGGSGKACLNPCAGVTCPNKEKCTSPNGMSYTCGNFANLTQQAKQMPMTVGTGMPPTTTTTVAPTTTTTAAPAAPTSGSTMAPGGSSPTMAPAPTGSSPSTKATTTTTMAPPPPVNNNTTMAPTTGNGTPGTPGTGPTTMAPTGAPTGSPASTGKPTPAPTTKKPTPAPTNPPTTQGAAGMWSSLCLAVTASLLAVSRLL